MNHGYKNISGIPAEVLRARARATHEMTSGRAELCRAMKRGEVSPDVAIRDERLRSQRMRRFLAYVPNIGDKGARDLLRKVGADEEARVRALSARQLEALLEVACDSFRKATRAGGGR